GGTDDHGSELVARPRRDREGDRSRRGRVRDRPRGARGHSGPASLTTRGRLFETSLINSRLCPPNLPVPASSPRATVPRSATWPPLIPPSLGSSPRLARVRCGPIPTFSTS